MARRIPCIAAALLLAWTPAAVGQVAVETWGADERASHPKTVTLAGAPDGPKTITIDLSALKKAKVLAARLRVERDRITGADEAARTAPAIFPVAGGKSAKTPLKLMGPWYDAFDAAGWVRAVQAGRAAPTLHVKAFPKWRPDATRLEITYEGAGAVKCPAAVKSVKALHRAGQTFITWAEIEDPFAGKPVTLGRFRDHVAAMKTKRRVRYRVYRHSRRIDAKTIASAELLAEVAPGSAYNVRGASLNRLICRHQKRAVTDATFARRIARGPFRGYRPNMTQMGEVLLDRLAIEDGKPLPSGTGLYVHAPPKAGKAYYAVVVAIDGTANVRDFSAACSLPTPVDEKPGGGEPVFQGLEDLKVFYDYAGQRRRYVQWCAPPLANRPNQYYTWGVFVPAGAEARKQLALGIYFHDGMALFLKPPWPHPKDMILIAPHDPEGTFGYGYHEALGTLRAFDGGAVADYTARRIDAFVAWVRRTYAIDPARMSCHGQGALGGTAALHYGLRHAKRFALIVAGRFDADPKSTPRLIQMDRRRRRTHLPALEAVWGKKAWGLKTPAGKSIWDDRDMVAFVTDHPKVSLPFLSLGTGSQHSTWPQENALMKALWAAKQPFWTDFTWGGQAPRVAPLSARRDRVILAAAPNEAMLKRARWYKHDRWQKAAMGYWGGGAIGSGAVPTDVIDTPDRLELTAQIYGHVTIRNVQKFKLKPGEKVRWRVKTGRRDPPSGVAAANADGLLTIANLSLRGRLIVTRMSAEPATQKGTNP